jgi:hypothetical protein
VDKPGETVEQFFCGVCVTTAPLNQHHVYPKGMGGTKDPGPTVTLCGFGNVNGCHAQAHGGGLELRWDDGWEWRRGDMPWVPYTMAL